MSTFSFSPVSEPRRRGRPPGGAQDSAAERSERIIVAALDLLGEDGLEGLTIRAVLTRTGLSRRAFYERFAGKDDLVLAVFAYSLRWAAEDLVEAFKTIPDPLERLHLIVDSIASALDEPSKQRDTGVTRRSAALSREHLRLAEARPNDLQDALHPLIALIAQTLTEGMETGQVRRTSAETLATLVYNLVAGTLHTQLLVDEEGGTTAGRDAGMAQHIWEFCRRAVCA